MLKRRYGWSYGEPEQFITVLELPPVDSAQSAGRLVGWVMSLEMIESGSGVSDKKGERTWKMNLHIKF